MIDAGTAWPREQYRITARDTYEADPDLIDELNRVRPVRPAWRTEDLATGDTLIVLPATVPCITTLPRKDTQ